MSKVRILFILINKLQKYDKKVCKNFKSQFNLYSKKNSWDHNQILKERKDSEKGDVKNTDKK